MLGGAGGGGRMGNGPGGGSNWKAWAGAGLLVWAAALQAHVWSIEPEWRARQQQEGGGAAPQKLWFWQRWSGD